ncbi:MAG TPA: hypothetical protein VND93_34155, partial [Myxococcales bacterium]|nr:hypothetical protein [Myxococcales bacterium]
MSVTKRMLLAVAMLGLGVRCIYVPARGRVYAPPPAVVVTPAPPPPPVRVVPAPPPAQPAPTPVPPPPPAMIS